MNYLHLTGYKTFKNIQLDLSPINILIGANRLYNRSLREYIALKGGEDKMLFRGKRDQATNNV